MEHHTLPDVKSSFILTPDHLGGIEFDLQLLWSAQTFDSHINSGGLLALITGEYRMEFRVNLCFCFTGAFLQKLEENFKTFYFKSEIDRSCHLAPETDVAQISFLMYKLDRDPHISRVRIGRQGAHQFFHITLART